MEKNINQVVGASFEDLNTEDMKQIQGAGDVDAEAISVLSLSIPIVPTCPPVISPVGK